MVRRSLLTVFSLFVALSVHGQNWQTIHSTDTQYFYTRGKIQMSVRRPIIRAITVEQTAVAATDTIFYFPNAWRDTTGGVNSYNSKCIDPIAPSWMGRMCIRHASGEEWYFNRQNDTIKIETQAQLGDSWTFFDDHRGLTFRATIIAADTATWGTTVDSFKLASIQAFNGTNPINSYANKLVLKWTKHNGWMQTLDLYAFPRRDPVWDYVGECIDTTQHTRLPAEWPKQNLIAEDIYSKFQPGNEWNYVSKRVDYSGTTVYNYEFDSITNVTPLGGVQLKVEWFHRNYSVTYYNGPNSPPGVYSSGTSSGVAQPSTKLLQLKDVYFYDTILHKSVATLVTQRVYTDTSGYCGNYVVEQMDITPCSRPPMYNGAAGCYQASCIDGVDMHRNRYLSNFGQIYHYYEFNDLATYSRLEEWSYSYIKLGSCKYGVKKDLSYLTVPELTSGEFKAYPNPANSSLNIELPTANGLFEASLFNGMGQCVLKQQFDGKTATMNVASVPAGLYWLEIKNEQGRAVKKIVVAH